MADSILTADACRIARAALGLSLEDLADAARLSPGDMEAFEGGAPAAPPTVRMIEDAFRAAGVSFHARADGRTVMRVRTLDGMIETPVSLSRPPF